MLSIARARGQGRNSKDGSQSRGAVQSVCPGPQVQAYLRRRGVHDSGSRRGAEPHRGRSAEHEIRADRWTVHAEACRHRPEPHRDNGRRRRRHAGAVTHRAGRSEVRCGQRPRAGTAGERPARRRDQGLSDALCRTRERAGAGARSSGDGTRPRGDEARPEGPHHQLAYEWRIPRQSEILADPGSRRGARRAALHPSARAIAQHRGPRS